MTTRYWLEKKTFVYGLYPDTCVNDAFSEWWADQDYWSDDDLNGPSGKFAPINQQRLTDFLIANPLATDGFPAALYVVFMVFFFVLSVGSVTAHAASTASFLHFPCWV